MPIAILIVGIFFYFIPESKEKATVFIFLTVAGLFVGFAQEASAIQTITAIKTDFGGAVGHLGLILGFGIVFGRILANRAKTGKPDPILDRRIRATERHQGNNGGRIYHRHHVLLGNYSLSDAVNRHRGWVFLPESDIPTPASGFPYSFKAPDQYGNRLLIPTARYSGQAFTAQEPRGSAIGPCIAPAPRISIPTTTIGKCGTRL